MIRKMLLCLAVLVSTGYAQVFANLQNDVAQITFCVGPSCAGGQSEPTRFSAVEGVAPDGTPSLEFSESGGAYANTLAYFNNGVISANYFMHHVRFYVDANTLDTAQALEFDNYVYLAPYRWMFGSQCVIGGVWDGWNDNLNQWMSTKIPCRLKIGWNDLTEWSHRTLALGCKGNGAMMPCSSQDQWEINGVLYPVNLVTPASALPKGWSSASGAQVQLDTNARGGSLTVWYSDWVFTELGQ